MKRILLLESTTWLTAAVPAQAILSQLHSELAAFMNQQELRERFVGAGIELGIYV